LELEAAVNEPIILILAINAYLWAVIIRVGMAVFA
jgi:hypothetical protein